MNRLMALMLELIAWAAGSLAITVALAVVTSWLFENAAPPNSSAGLVVNAAGRLLVWHSTKHQGQTLVEYSSPDRQAVTADTPAAFGLELSGPRRHQPAPRRNHARAVTHGLLGSGECWFAVRPAAEPGHGYLVGYDQRSRRCLGYLGTDGYRLEPPPPDRQFVAPAQNEWSWTQPCYAPARQGGSLYRYQTIMVLAKDRLWLASPTSRLLQALTDAPDLVSATDHALVTWPQLRHEAQQWRTVADRVPDGEFALRTADRILVVSAQGRPCASVPLPPSLREDDLTLFLGNDGRHFVVRSNQPWVSRAYELRPDGSASLLAEVALPHRPVDPDADAKAACTAAGNLLPALLVIATEARNREGRLDRGAIAKQAGVLRWPLRLALAIGLVAAVLTWRHQRRHRARFTWLRVPLAVLAGVPGWLAYRYLRRWPAIEPCARCSRPTPVDRATCVTCGHALTPQAPSPRPLPALREP